MNAKVFGHTAKVVDDVPVPSGWRRPTLAIVLAAGVLLLAGCSSRPAGRFKHAVGGFLLYKRLGIDIYSTRNDCRITMVHVYPAGSPHRTHRHVGKYEAVPGVGAYGVYLGESEKSISSAEVGSASAPQAAKGRVKYAGCQFRDGRWLDVDILNGRVVGLDVTGPFTTPQGVSNRTTLEQAKRIYGDSDGVPGMARAFLRSGR